MATIPVERVMERLWPEGDDGKTWAILDGARDPRIHFGVLASDLDQMCLYTGPLAPSLARAAPYLVRLERRAPFTRQLLEEGWGQSWGVFARANVMMTVLHRHLRRFLRVRTEDGKALLFRYYDPRVLRVYLPTCTAAELEQVFGPVSSYLAEGVDPAQMLSFQRGPKGLTTDEARFDKRLAWLGDYLRKHRDDPGG